MRQMPPPRLRFLKMLGAIGNLGCAVPPKRAWWHRPARGSLSTVLLWADRLRSDRGEGAKQSCGERGVRRGGGVSPASYGRPPEVPVWPIHLASTQPHPRAVVGAPAPRV